MEKDRTAICNIIGEMLDNPDEVGIYPTTKACDALETLVNDERVIAIGWTHADACVDLDQGNDPRKKEISSMLDRALVDLNQP